MAHSPDVRAAQALIEAAATSAPAGHEAKPWDHGWSVKEYRESEAACLTSPSGPIKLSEDGKRAYARAVANLLANAGVKRRWEPTEVWEVAGSLLAHVASGQLSEDEVRSWIDWLKDAPESVNAFPVANLSWSGSPIVVGKSLLGRANAEFVEAAESALNLSDSTREEFDEYVKKQEACTGSGQIVLFACRTVAQSQRAHLEARSAFDAISELLLLLVPSREALNLFSGRGDASRPGVRGLRLDRLAMERYLGEHARHEMASSPLVVSGPVRGARLYWASPELLPVERLLGIDVVRDMLVRALALDGPIASRLRVSARWFSQAFWATDREDSALALGVALDALIGSKAALPSKAMAERFAFLEANPSDRGVRSKRYGEIFGVRSAVAHGGTSSKIQEPGYLRAVENDVSWAARRLLAVQDAFNPKSQEEFDSFFDSLRWGTADWPDEYSKDLDLTLPTAIKDQTQPCGRSAPGQG